MAYTNSKLISYTKLSPNHSGQRTHSIDRITPHCVVGQLSAESICGCFTSPSRQASCNYGIGLVSLSEFNKLTEINRKTFSPFWVEIMPKIP